MKPGLGVLHRDQVGVDGQQQRGLPLAGVQPPLGQRDAVLTLSHLGDLKQHAEIREGGDRLWLVELGHRGREGRELAAVSGHEHNPAEAAPQQRAHQIADHGVKGALR